MNDEHGLVPRQHLTAADLADLAALAEVCGRHDGCDLAFVVDMAAGFAGRELPQPFYYARGQLLGMMAFQGQAEDLEVTGLVHPAHRRRGIGRVLLAATTAACAQHAITSLLLVCADAAPSGQAFATAVGARYRFSEYRMALMAAAGDQPPAAAPLQLQPVQAGELAEFVQVRAAFGDGEEQVRRRFAADIDRPDRRLYLARWDGTAVGTVRTTRHDQDTFITTLGVLPQYRGRGFGRQILQQTIARLQAEGWRRILIEVATDNQRALSLYHACGFREISAYAYYHLALAPQPAAGG